MNRNGLQLIISSVVKDEDRPILTASSINHNVTLILKFLLTGFFDIILPFLQQIRGIFFDKIERNDVEIMINSIYKHVNSLEDIQFLLKYATALFPQSPNNPDCGLLILSNILQLQGELTTKRQVHDHIRNLLPSISFYLFFDYNFSLSFSLHIYLSFFPTFNTFSHL